MSSLGRGNSRGRARGTSLNKTITIGPPNGPSRGRGARSISTTRQQNNATRGGFGQAARGGASRAPRSAAPSGQDSGGVKFAGPLTKKNLEQRRTALREAREKEKKKAIRDGLMNDPDKSIKLSEAITMVATCTDKCPQFERVDRAFKNDIAEAEKNPDPSVYGDGEIHMDEDRMVKSFKRSAAGDELPIPSDLRTPLTLKETLDYLLYDVLGDDLSTDHLGKVHGFLWDRTRAIRKDFSVQQLTKIDDLKIAIECFERIARLHILYLHVLAVPGAAERYSYSHQQEVEQLDKTLLSLMQYYDDTRGRLECKNEAEFRTYCIIFQLQDPQTPDLEDRVQTWPRHISGDPRVQEALNIYAAACNTSDLQGPFPSDKTVQVIARQDWARFWDVIASTRVSYLMGCVAEVYFNYVREMALKGIIGSAQVLRAGQENLAWTMDSMWDMFNFDTEEQLEHFCSLYGLQFRTKDDGTRCLAIAVRSLPARLGDLHQQKSRLVENKRQGRSLPAVVDGLSIREARNENRIIEDENEEETEYMQDAVPMSDGEIAEDADERSDEESLFVSETRKGVKSDPQPAAVTSGFSFGQPTSNPFASKSPFAPSPSFGNPSSTSPFAPKPADTTSSNGDNSKSGIQLPGAVGTQVGATFMMPNSAKPLASFPTSSNEPATQGLGITAPTATANSTATAPAQSSFSAFKDIFTSKADASTSSLFPPTASALSAPKAPSPEPPQSLSAAQSTSSFGGINTGPAKTSLFPEQPTKSAASVPAFNWGQTGGSSVQPLQVDTNSRSQTQTQPHINTPPVTSPPSQSAPEPSPSLLNPGSISPSRRQSINSGQDTRPKKPSPLKESYTAEASDQSALLTSPKDTGIRSSQSALVPSAAAEFEDTVTRYAEELTFEPTAGILKQYVDYFVRTVVTRVQEKVCFERLEAEAKYFRETFLAVKYFQKWRTQARATYLRKRGQESRARRRDRLTRSLVEKGELDASVLNDLPFGRSSRASSRRTPLHAPQHDEARRIDAMFRSTNGGSHFNAQARAGSKRPAASLDQELMPPPSTTVQHKRAKSISHVDNRGRSTKPPATPTSNSYADSLQRSSFLGYSAAERGESRPSTTKSDYFRLKARGLKPYTSDASVRGTKRSREDDLDAASEKLERSRLRLGSSSARSSVSDQPHGGDSTRASSPASVRSKIDNDDEALFARLRAAREALKEGSNFFKSEINKEEEFRRSRSASQSDHDSPSMARARSEARMRASLGDTDGGASSRDVPAYRLRESRFVPREEYGRAIERANEMRASRSRAGSRPESRAEQRPSDAVQPNKTTTCVSSATDNSLSKASWSSINGHDNSAGAFAALAKATPATQNSFSNFGFGSQPSPAANTGFSQHITKDSPFSQSSSVAPTITSGVNPFLKDKAPAFGAAAANISDNPFSQSQQSAFGSFGFSGATQNSNPAAFIQETNADSGTAQRVKVEDHTIQPEQIPVALSNSFGHQVYQHQSPFASTTHGSPKPPETNSHLQSQAASAPISLLSDDEGEENDQVDSTDMPNGQQEFYNALHKAANTDGGSAAAANHGTTSFNSHSHSTLHNSYANKFAALSGHNQDEDEGGEESQELEDDDGNLYAEEDPQQEPDSYQHGNVLDDEALEDEEEESDGLEMPNGGYNQGYNDGYSGEDDELDGEEGDIQDSDEDGYDEEDDDEHPPFYANNHFSRGNYRAMPKRESPPVNPALMAVGNNKDEPIDLDSD